MGKKVRRNTEEERRRNGGGTEEERRRNLIHIEEDIGDLIFVM